MLINGSAQGLVEELENPDNTQRWRALEGTDLNMWDDDAVVEVLSLQ